jgi:hypothetical protein
MGLSRAAFGLFDETLQVLYQSGDSGNQISGLAAGWGNEVHDLGILQRGHASMTIPVVHFGISVGGFVRPPTPAHATVEVDRGVTVAALHRQAIWLGFPQLIWHFCDPFVRWYLGILEDPSRETHC